MQYSSYGANKCGDDRCLTRHCASLARSATDHGVCTWRTVEGEAPGVGGGGAEDVLAAGGGHHRVVAGLAAPALSPDRGPGHQHQLEIGKLCKLGICFVYDLCAVCVYFYYVLVLAILMPNFLIQLSSSRVEPHLR